MTETGSTVERLVRAHEALDAEVQEVNRDNREAPWLLPSGYDTFLVAAFANEAHATLPLLLAVVEAAQEFDDNWEAVNRCYTLGHPYSQNLRRALYGVSTAKPLTRAKLRGRENTA